jgi:hypothetical protein
MASVVGEAIDDEDELLLEAPASDDSASPPQAARPRGRDRARAAMALRRM